MINKDKFDNKKIIDIFSIKNDNVYKMFSYIIIAKYTLNSNI